MSKTIAATAGAQIKSVLLTTTAVTAVVSAFFGHSFQAQAQVVIGGAPVSQVQVNLQGLENQPGGPVLVTGSNLGQRQLPNIQASDPAMHPEASGYEQEVGQTGAVLRRPIGVQLISPGIPNGKGTVTLKAPGSAGNTGTSAQHLPQAYGQGQALKLKIPGGALQQPSGPVQLKAPNVATMSQPVVAVNPLAMPQQGPVGLVRRPQAPTRLPSMPTVAAHVSQQPTVVQSQPLPLPQQPATVAPRSRPVLPAQAIQPVQPIQPMIQAPMVAQAPRPVLPTPVQPVTQPQSAPLPTEQVAAAPIAPARPHEINPSAPPKPMTMAPAEAVQTSPLPQVAPPLPAQNTAPVEDVLPPAPPKVVAKEMVRPAPMPLRSREHTTPAQPAQPTQLATAEPRVSDVTIPEDGGLALTVGFAGGNSTLSPTAKSALEHLAGRLGESPDRMTLKAYAGGSAETVSAARRLSLTRALAVRSYLIKQGIRSTRIDVQALGIGADGGNPERVDILLKSAY